MHSLDKAILRLRDDPRYADLVRDAYLDRDVVAAARRFCQSAEFAAVLGLLKERVKNAVILDLGAGAGIASYAFAVHGARQIYALEPDASDEVGRGAINRLCGPYPIEPIDAFGEDIPLPEAVVDIVYARQVLHHTRDLPQVMLECARVLKPGGILLACREHVVDNDVQLAQFLASHPIHQLAGGENAYRLPQYLDAIQRADLEVRQVFGPWDSLINAFPVVRTQEELEHFPQIMYRRKLGQLGDMISRLPGATTLAWMRIKRPRPGRMYTFLAVKP